MPSYTKKSARLQFSLRTFLITTCTVGVGLGILGRQFLNDPEMFLGVLGVLSTVVPFLLAVGTIAWMGVRGRQSCVRNYGDDLTVAESQQHADIILTPNPRHIEHRPEVSEIWGKKVFLRGVSLERLDLEAEVK